MKSYICLESAAAHPSVCRLIRERCGIRIVKPTNIHVGHKTDVTRGVAYSLDLENLLQAKIKKLEMAVQAVKPMEVEVCDWAY